MPRAQHAPALSMDRMISSRRGKVRKISEEGKGECRKMPHLRETEGRGEACGCGQGCEKRGGLVLPGSPDPAWVAKQRQLGSHSQHAH